MNRILGMKVEEWDRDILRVVSEPQYGRFVERSFDFSFMGKP